MKFSIISHFGKVGPLCQAPAVHADFSELFPEFPGILMKYDPMHPPACSGFHIQREIVDKHAFFGVEVISA